MVLANSGSILYTERRNFPQVAGLAQYSLESPPVDLAGVSCRFADIDPDPFRLGALQQNRATAGDNPASASLGVVDINQGVADVTLPSKLAFLPQERR
jgi:hypothetical protein